MLRIWSPRTQVDLRKLLDTKWICWVHAKNQSFCQRVQLNESHDSTLHYLQRYATLSFHPPHFSTERKRNKKKWWGWLECTFGHHLPNKKLFSRQGTCMPLETSATPKSKECSQNSVGLLELVVGGSIVPPGADEGLVVTANASPHVTRSWNLGS